MLIQEYKTSWIQDFTDIENLINEAFVNLTISIEHIGSTAIPGLAAKPIIDMDISFDSRVEFDEVKIRLERIGYIHAGNQGIPGREVFKRSKTVAKQAILDFIPHHLYVCPNDSEELKKHLLFRDFLRANADARIAYQNLKYEIAGEANQDRKKYAELKEAKATKFINTIIAKAKNY
jgi:GrpB-like predicted nucleotidyltransferase (UPF0157 family)